MNELIFADQELEVGFIEKLDVLLEGIERMGASCKTLPSNEQFLTDKEVSAWLKVSRRTLQDYRNNGMIAYYPTTSWAAKSCTRNQTSKRW